MIGLAKVIGRLIAVLVENGTITRPQADWILKPAEETIKAESEDK